MIECRECARTMPSDAKICPHCGASMAPAWHGVIRFVSTLFFAFLAAGVILFIRFA